MKLLRIIGLIMIAPLIITIYLSLLSIKVTSLALIITAAVIGTLLLIGSTNQKGTK